MSGNWLRLVVAAGALCFLAFVVPDARAQSDATLVAQADALVGAALDTVVVTSSSNEETVREVTSNITVITSEDIEMSTATDMSGLLAEHGFTFYSTFGNSNVYIRGIGTPYYNPDYTSTVPILINGVRSSAFELSVWNLNNIERVEIIRGPAAVQYGPAAGGVINVITKRGSEDFAATLQIGGGSFRRFEQNFAFSGAAAGLDFAVGFVNSRQGDDYSLGGGADVPHTGYDQKYSADIDIGYTFLKNHRIGFHYTYNLIDNMQTPTGGFGATSLDPINYNSYDQKRFNTIFTYAGKLNNERFSWLAQYSFGKNKSDAISTLPGNDVNYSNEIEELKLQITYDYGILSTTIGLDHIKYEYYMYGWSKYTSTIDDLAGYLLGKLRLFDNKLIISFGGRYETYESGYSQSPNKVKIDNFMPSIGIAYIFNDMLKLRGNYSEGFSLPSTDRITGYTNANPPYDPNPNLKPQESTNLEFGVDFSHKFIDASLTYFTTDLKGKFASTSLPNGHMQFINLDEKATYSGIEASFSFDVAKFFDRDFSLIPYVNFTWMTDRINRSPTVFMPQKPNLLLDVVDKTANYGVKFSHPAYNFSGTFNAIYIGTKYSQDWDYTSPTYYEYVKFGGFTIVNLSLNKGLWDFADKGHIYLVAQLNNIFDENYAYTMDYPMPGRNFYFGVGYEF